MNLQLACLEEAKLIKRFANHWTSVQGSNHLLELCHDGIKLSLLQKYSTSFSLIKPARKNTSRKNPDIQHHKCSVPSSSFSTCTYLVYLERPSENYKTLHRLNLLEKSSERATRKPAKGMIFRPLLRKVIYRMLPLLPIMQGLFWYCWRH